MKKFIIILVVFVSISYGIEYSLRMRALGTNFAYLIPDYETDLYLNPNLIGEKKLKSVEYNRYLNSPLTLRWFGKRFAWGGQYWGSYDVQDKPDDYYRKDYNLAINDSWMLDLRDKLPKFLASDVWNIRNDFLYTHYYRYWSEIDFVKKWTLKYILKSNASIKLSSDATLVTRVAGGVYRDYWHYFDPTPVVYDKWIMLFSTRLGVYYRKNPGPNEFTSWYIDVGGPLSTSTIDQLPYSIFSNISLFDEFEFSFYAKTFIGQCGYGKSFPLSNNGFVCFGIHERFLVQHTEVADMDQYLRGINNGLSLPIAVEYNINRVAIRFGTCLSYRLELRKQWDDFSTISHRKTHWLQMKYSFGLSWQPSKKVAIDLYNDGYLERLTSWAICLTYKP